METHVKVLAVLYIVFGAFGTLAAFGIMALFGAIGVVGTASDPDACARLFAARPSVGVST